MHHEYCIIFSGQVQGVFFRAKAKNHAGSMGLNGTARNLSNGDVEVCINGTKKDADRLIAAMKSEPPPIEITSAEVTEKPNPHTYRGFIIIN